MRSSGATGGPFWMLHGSARAATLWQEEVRARMTISTDIRDATVDDAPRISALLTALAEEFIVGEFSEQGRLHLLVHFGVSVR